LPLAEDPSVVSKPLIIHLYSPFMAAQKIVIIIINMKKKT